MSLAHFNLVVILSASLLVRDNQFQLTLIIVIESVMIQCHLLSIHREGKLVVLC